MTAPDGKAYLVRLWRCDGEGSYCQGSRAKALDAAVGERVICPVCGRRAVISQRGGVWRHNGPVDAHGQMVGKRFNQW